ncbi:hypothetical protein [Agromyces italicus]|uniref:hypothetical protein n=1 Tax=Agromyces italicus TaxID=279572 RepID=UPI000401DEC4|nr:hypothetical protein [Agromyces italicus]
MPEPTPDERRDATEQDATAELATERFDTARIDGTAQTLAFDRMLADEPPTALVPPVPPAPFDAPAATATLATAPLPRPTVRWGALVWALLFGTIAGFTLWTLVDLQHRDEVLFWIAAVPMPLVPLYLLAVAGIVVALFGIVGLIRRGERQRRAARG